jgi:beta-glucanase (GH16 family)
MKYDGGQGVWPAFWLLPTDKSWPPEIDSMENLGNKPSEILQTLHWLDNNEQRKKDSSVITGSDFTEGWHKYAVNWQKGKIEWYIDDKLTKTTSGNNIPDKPMEIILNLAIGGLLPGNADATTQFPRNLSIDYIRVYEEKPTNN